MKQKIMDTYKILKFKIKQWYKYSFIRRIIKCLYENSSKNTQRNLDYHVTKLLNPKLAKECDAINAMMLKQSNADREAAAQLVESCRMTPDKILNSRGNLTSSQIVPELTPGQKARMLSIEKMLFSEEGGNIPVMDNEAGLWARKEVKVMPASEETEVEMRMLGLFQFKPKKEPVKKKAKKKPVALPKKTAKKPIRRLSDDLQGVTKNPVKEKRK